VLGRHLVRNGGAGRADHALPVACPHPGLPAHRADGDARHMSESTQTARLSRSGSLLAAAARYGVWVVLAALFLTLPKIFTGGFALTLLSLMGISIIFTLSYNMLLGQTGMLSFGHAVYYGLGAFIVVHGINVITRNSLPIPLPVMPIIGGLAGLFFGILFGPRA